MAQNWSEEYAKGYGAARAFAKAVVDTYRAIDKLPAFMRWETERIGESKVSTLRTLDEDSEGLFKELERIMRDVYHEYRSPFAHTGRKLELAVRAKTRIGFPSTPGSISVQDLGEITLQVMKLNLTSK